MVVPYSTPQTQQKSQILNKKTGNCIFGNFQKTSFFFLPFLTKTTVPTSILTSEGTDIAPQTQPELGNMPGTQSGKWRSLVQHMCKSQQTMSVKDNVLIMTKTLSIITYFAHFE